MKKIKLPENISKNALYSLEYDENEKEINEFVETGKIENLVDSVESQPIAHNDLESYHWFFDFQFNGFWVSGGKFNWGKKNKTKINLTLYR